MSGSVFASARTTKIATGYLATLRALGSCTCRATIGVH